MRSPSSVFVLCLSICPRPGGSHFQQSWQLFRIDRGRPSLQNPRFQAFRVQNRHFCALLSSETPIFGHFEHKIEIFVRFCPPKPPFSGISSTKSAFLCQKRRFFPGFGPFRAQNRAFCARADRQVASGSVKVTFVQFTAHDNVLQRCLEQGVACSVICTNDAPTKLQPYPALNTCSPARRQPHPAEIRRWRRQSVQMGRQIGVCLSSSSMWYEGEWAHLYK